MNQLIFVPYGGIFEEMSSQEYTPTGEWSAKIARYVIYIVSLFTIIGIPLAILSANLIVILIGIQTGVTVSILYLVYKIAQEVHYFTRTY